MVCFWIVYVGGLPLLCPIKLKQTKHMKTLLKSIFCGTSKKATTTKEEVKQQDCNGHYVESRANLSFIKFPNRRK